MEISLFIYPIKVDLSFAGKTVRPKYGFHLYDYEHKIHLVDYSFERLPQTHLNFLKFIVQNSKVDGLKEAIRFVYRNKKKIVVADREYTYDDYSHLFTDNNKAEQEGAQVIEMDSFLSVSAPE